MVDDLKIITWDDKYLIGNLEIDKEHQELFDLANRAIRASTIEDPNFLTEELKNILDDVSFYIGTHFFTEQMFMERIAYPKTKEHILEHKRILQELNNLVRSTARLDLKTVQQRISTFLEEVLVRHVKEDDHQIKLWNNRTEVETKTYVWKQSYEIGHEEIDKNQKYMFEIATKSLEAVEFHKRDEKIRDIINYLYEHMKVHFKVEEKFMEEKYYPYVKDHQTMHKDIIQKVNNFVIQLPYADTQIFEKELSLIIDSIFIKHIIEDDGLFRAWLRGDEYSI